MTYSESKIFRVPFNHPGAKENLADAIRRLFSQHSEDSGFSGFEVVVTFNAVLANKDQTSFSVFYGADFRPDNAGGAARSFRHKCEFFEKIDSQICAC